MGSGNSANGGSIKQAVKCITVGGNSPITGSCNNDGTNTNTNSGGNVGSGNSANGGSNGQVAECITVGGNSPITGSCTNGDADTNVNTGGTLIPTTALPRLSITALLRVPA